MVESTLQRQIVVLATPEALTDHERFDAAVPRAAGLGDRHAVEQEAELAVQQSDVPAAKDFGDKTTALRQDVTRDVDGGQEELALDVLVDVVQSRHVGGAVAHDQFGPPAAEVPDDGLGGLEGGDVALEAVDAGEGRHGLEIDRDDLHLLLLLFLAVIDTIALLFGWLLLLLVIPANVVIVIVMDQPVGQHLRPRARRRAQVDGPPDAPDASARTITIGRRRRLALGAEDVELLVELEELEGRPGPVSGLLGPPVEHVALVAGEASHVFLRSLAACFAWL